ncbi:PucR family transcriptional regulator [Actinomycetes bacterium M1A6_2h]
MTPVEFLVSWTARLTAKSVAEGHSVLAKDDRDALSLAASRWISSGISIDSALEACRESGARVLADWSVETGTAAAAAARAVVALVSEATTTVGDEYHRANSTFMASSSSSEALARILSSWPLPSFHDFVPGRDGHERYEVAVLLIPDAHNDHRSMTVRRAIGDVYGPAHDVVTLFDPGHVTVLVPSAIELPHVDRLVERLCAAFGRSILGATVDSATSNVPEAIRFSVDLIALARELGRPSKLYRTHELVLEYQMARPGYGRAALGSVLDPLRDRPVLLETIVTFIKAGQSRKTASRLLFIHPNTLDSRLKKISRVVGFDITSVAGRFKIEAAILIEDLDRAATG